MSSNDLWSLHVKVSQLLQQKIQQEKLRLEERLKQYKFECQGALAVPACTPPYLQS